MKVLILGPVVNDKVSGGVAVFDEGLYQGFKELHDEVNIVSIGKSNLIDNISLSLKKPNPYRLIFHLRKIANIIKKNKPDLVISSLHYSVGIKVYKRKWPHAKYVQVLHGTPTPLNGIFKAWCINKVARYTKKHFDKLVTVSHLSWAINKKINRVECDSIINTGCTFSYCSTNYEKEYDFCYVGRLYRDKNITKMMDAFVALHNEKPTLKVCIAGFGEQENLFAKNGPYDLDFVDFLGRVKHEDVSTIYAKSKFFISLCELEGCGLSFSEAAICGCNPIASLSSGQSYLFRNKKYYHTVDASSVFVLVNELKGVMNNYKKISQQETEELLSIFSYKNIAQRYKDLFNE